MSAVHTGRKPAFGQGTQGSRTSGTKRKKFQCPSCPHGTNSYTSLKAHILRIHKGYKPFACNFCSRKFAAKDDLHRHIRRHTGEKIFKCSQCEEEFSGKNALYVHIFSRHSSDSAANRPFHCEEPGCESTFILKVGLQTHVSNFHKKSSNTKSWPCALCPKVLKTDTSWQCHIRSHMGEKPYKCSECDFTTRQQEALTNHVRPRHSEGYEFPCDFPGCGAKFKVKGSLKLHVDVFHKQITRFRCPNCPKDFYKRYSMKVHYKRFHTKEKPFQCDLCEFRALNHSAITKHRRYTHSEYMSLSCIDCEVKFKNEDTLRQHRNKKHTGKPKITKLFQCPESNCEKEYKSQIGLKIHIRGYHTENMKPLSCPLCSYASSYSGNLTQHMRLHTTEAPYKCKDCGRCFKQSSTLHTHKTHAHSEERPFKCKLCPYQGKTTKSLKKHEQTHNPNPDKPFSCRKCPFKCTTKAILNRHLVTHNKERPFECEQCSFKAKRIDVLRNHTKTHADLKPHTCHKCQRSFKTSTGLVIHMSTHEEARPIVCGVEGCTARFKNELFRQGM